MAAHTRFPLRFCLALVCASACWFPPTSRAANEAGLLVLWKAHLSAPDDHQAAIASCKAFAASNRSDPLLPVVHSIEAWHQFRAGKIEEGVRLTEPYLTAPQSPIANCARSLAQGWMTRIDREKVVAALKLYYRNEVAFPKTLEELAKHPKIPDEALPPWTDRFGKPWRYQLVGFGSTPGFEDQKYSLESSTLGKLSDFKTALAVPYASRIEAVPEQIFATPGTPPAVRFNTPGQGPTLVGVGLASGNLHLAYVGSQIVIVSDYAHWNILPKP